MHLCYNDYSPKRDTKGDGNMQVYLTWYRDMRNGETHLWGVYGTAEKAESEKRKAEELDLLAWVNEEEVQ